jgi:predicted transcriptional regulator YdeE
MKVSDEAKVPEGMIANKTPAAEYAVFEHHVAWRKCIRIMSISSASGLRKTLSDGRADSLEIYDQRFNPESADSIFEIWIPIIKA